MKSNCSYASVSLAIAAALFLAACVDLTKPWLGSGDASSPDGGAAAAGGSDGATPDVAMDVGAGGAGGGTVTDVAATGGSAAGGTTASTQVDGSTAADTSVMEAASESGAGDSGGILAMDAGASLDTVPPQDVAMDVPLFADTNPPADLSADNSNRAEAGASDGAGTGGSGSLATDGTAGVETGGGSSAKILSIDFVGGIPNGTSPPSGTVALAASEAAGVKLATHWNSATSATGTLSSLVLAGGDVTAASANWSMTPLDGAIDTWSNSFADVPGDTRMMNGYLDPRSSSLPATIKVTGLPDPMSNGYDVYVYCYSSMDSPDTRVYEYTIGQTTHSATQTGPSASTFPGYSLASPADGGTAGSGNYVVFRNVTGSSFTLTAQPRPSTFGMERAPVNGIQIVYPSGY
jgi:hypothetical protein